MSPVPAIAATQTRARVRPWALSAPVAVLLVALPLVQLRGLDELSENEKSRLATVQAIVEHHTLAIDQVHPHLRATSDRIAGHRAVSGQLVPSEQYSKLPPVMSVILAGLYWPMHLAGLSFASQAPVAVYLLTIFGVTLPVALAAGMIYRMARLFELSRPWRAALGLVTVCGTGLISYSTVLSSNALAASLVLVACACLLHSATVARPQLAPLWVAAAGMVAGLATTIDLGAAVLAAVLLLIVFFFRWPAGARIRRGLIYALALLPPLALHAVMTIPVTGDVLPGFLHPELALSSPAPTAPAVTDVEDAQPPSAWRVSLGRVFCAVVGSRGLLSHFPIILVGLAGAGVVLRRHWPPMTKALASGSVAAAALAIGVYVVSNPDWSQPMFSARWFVLFLPLLVFWSGAWLRRPHHPATWLIAGILLIFSMGVAILGASAPYVQSPHGQYTAYTVARKLLHVQPGPLGPHTAAQGSLDWGRRR